MRLLLIEDNDAFVEVVRTTFLSKHALVVAPTLAAAHEHLGAPFDAALVDYDLPDGKGDELVRALLDARPNLPIIAISSHDRGNDALRSAGAGLTCAKSQFDRIERVLATAVGGLG